MTAIRKDRFNSDEGLEILTEEEARQITGPTPLEQFPSYPDSESDQRAADEDEAAARD